ncbi:MAG: hypothetical protein ACI4ES_15420 [Roseburia sp.]
MKKEYWMMILAFLGGIVGANLLGIEKLTSYGILNSYFLDKLSSVTIHYKELAVQIFLLRMKELVLLIVLSFVFKRVSVWKGCIFFLLFSLGFLVTASIFNFGWKGMVIAGGVLVPQWIFYGLSLYLLVRGSDKVNGVDGKLYHYQNRKEKYGMIFALYGAVLLIMSLGVVTESYINPTILRKLLKII